ncbi:MAG: MucB/RseB C-terminal domain-containing protein, partial [Candidatus Polarisedimenticolaceae bacterium]|nr:MucB/RseB C-terminal domain-containing protein [Candidatus Polarisedimenticolaceae bacterium]
QIELMEILHVVHGDTVQERLFSLNGAPREVIRNSESVTCIMPEVGRVSVDYRPENRGVSLIGLIDPKQLADRYQFSMMGSARIAGRAAKVVAIIPRDEYRYGYRLYLDEASGLPLKSDLMDEQGTPLEQIMFTSLEVSPTIPSQDSGAASNKRLPEVGQKSYDGHVEKRRWSFQALPMGFALTTYTHLSSKEGGKSAEHLVLSDGLASVSIFVEVGESEPRLDGASKMGAINAWGSLINGYQVTAVGEVPAVTVREVVQAMVLSDVVDIKDD